MKHGIALYGVNGHQIASKLKDNPRAAWLAACEIDPGDRAEVIRTDTLDELLKVPGLELISICSPRREHQAVDCMKALEAGLHVYAEKPAGMTEPELDRVLTCARANGRIFHSMSDTAFLQPYLAMRDELRNGAVGEIEQIHVRKSYPWHDKRPFDDGTDGGLLLWVGIHAARMVEHISGRRLKGGVSHLHKDFPPGETERKASLAVSVLAELDNGAPVTMAINVLNCSGTGIWGYEEVQVFGRDGIIESLAGGAVCRKVCGDGEYQTVDTSQPSLDFFECFLDELEGKPFPMTLEEEFSPERFLHRVKAVSF